MRALIVILSAFLFSTLSYSESIDEQCLREAYKDRNYKNAIISCQKAIEADKSNIKLYQALGGSYFGMKNYQKAIESYQKVLELNPTTPHHIWHANQMIAKSYGYLYNFESSVEYFRKANAAEDNNIETHMNLAATLRHMNRLDEAKIEYHKALDVARANNALEDVNFLEQEIKKYGF